jgi:hypothetical protein
MLKSTCPLPGASPMYVPMSSETLGLQAEQDRACSLHNSSHGEGSPGGRPPRPWKIACTVAFYAQTLASGSVSAQASPGTHVVTSTHTVTVSLCGHCALHRRWQLARIHVQIEPFTNE